MYELSLNIEITRKQLQDLLERGINPLDPYVIGVSQELDNLLNSYYTLFKIM